jgi:hypothetical protein
MADEETPPKEVPEAFFEVDGDRVVPSLLARGPWDEGSAHGGPIAAIVGRAIEQFEPDPDLQLLRLTAEILRPVPLQPLELRTTLLRPGKRVQLVGVSVMHGENEVMRATGLRVRRPPEEHELPDELHQLDHTLPSPESLPVRTERGVFGEGRVGIMDGIEMRAASNEFFAPGPATYWFRLTHPLVAGEPTSPLSRALVAADFGNGISQVVPIDTHIFINPDLTVYLHRLPRGEWVGLDARTWLEPGEGALAESDLHDEDGRIGRAVQGLYLSIR